MTRRSTSRCQLWCLLVVVLLLCFPSSIADDSPKKKGIFNKILGRFKKNEKNSNTVTDEKLTPETVDVVAADSAAVDSTDENSVLVDADVCTSDDQSCSATVDEVKSEPVADSMEETEEVTEETTKLMEYPTEEVSVDTTPEETADENSDISSVEEQSNTVPVEAETQCIDLHSKCATWAAEVDPETNLTPCATQSAYMHQMCPVSCNTCVLVEIEKLLRDFSEMIGQEGRIDPLCSDDDFNCVQWAKAGQCDTNKEYMHEMCNASCGLCSAKSNYFGSGQRTVNGKSQDLELTKTRIDETVKYMEKVNTDPEYKNVRSRCLNRNKDCAFWWAVGECTINEEYMNMFCAPSCQTCHLLPGFGTEG
ncbi:hypothetical protein ACHAWO_000614 [Cyclotella atomus]|uniref:ShKT domain-containing protein n=1 Tax=Cyclotella atomus TaxID=382360 RepID=A0ABD3N636_9STRA